MNILFYVNTWRIGLTLFCFGMFIGIALWAYGKKSKPGFDDIAQSIIHDCDQPVNKDPKP